MEAPSEKVFSAYNASQGQTYAQVRPDYDESVYRFVLEQHTANGGQLDRAIDLGCGPGNVCRALAPHFQDVVGLDPSAGMLATARELGGATAAGRAIQYKEGIAENLGRGEGGEDTAPGRAAAVDLITAANSAHWFDMPHFWGRAAAVLRPGGTVALWTTGVLCVHPDTPNAAGVQAVLDDFMQRRLAPYATQTNVTRTRDGYASIVLPWALPAADAAQDAFDESAFVRREWSLDEPFVERQSQGFVKLAQLGKVLSTGSSYAMWRKQNPGDVDTDRDLMNVFLSEVAAVLQAAGVVPGEEKVKGATKGVVLIIKKK